MRSPLRAAVSVSVEGARPPFVRVFEGENFLRSHQISPGTWMAGRDPSADIRLEGSTVSRRHFQFEYHGENRLYVQDLGSSNGTFLNGRRVNRSAIGHGDVIQIGEIRLVVNHQAFARPKVIPFPNIRTEPGVEIRKLEPALPPPKTSPEPGLRPLRPERAPAKPTRAPVVRRAVEKPRLKLARAAVLTATAGFLAWGVHSWISSRHAPEVAEVSAPAVGGAKVRATARAKDAVGALVQVQSKPRVPALPAPVAKEPPRASAEVSKERMPKSGEPLRLKEPPLKEGPAVQVRQATKSGEGEAFARSLEHSLGSIGEGDLGNVNKLGVSGPSESRPNLAALKKMDGKAGVVDIDIKFPSVEEMEKAAQAEPGTSQNAPPKGPNKFDAKQYQAMLKERIQGVDQCYYENVKNGAEGKVSVWFSIGTKGQVKRTGVESSTFANASLSACILEKIQKLQLEPPPFDGFTVTYGFRFGARRIRF
ncbi:MAG: FHA domain-containing protein [Pseudomonadota bacterium]